MALVIKSDHVIICTQKGAGGWATKRGINSKLNLVGKQDAQHSLSQENFEGKRENKKG